ncbi:hypothetical protein F383_32649 [Gossypium arboreum]|uniref:Uncharacterized protein n=1 Tax=Gossypium arboreum TaxID=29729 RepID=A0A0B0MVB7_GOSAR|nr:hypothetical protein F383_32649 [Gossypium arboreum]
MVSLSHALNQDSHITMHHVTCLRWAHHSAFSFLYLILNPLSFLEISMDYPFTVKS